MKINLHFRAFEEVKILLYASWRASRLKLTPVRYNNVDRLREISNAFENRRKCITRFAVGAVVFT